MQLQTGWQEEIDKPHGSTPFVWLVTIPLVYSDTLNLVARITNHPERVTFNALDWEPWPLEMSAIQESPEDVPQINLLIGNHGRLLARYLEDPQDSSGMMGRNATVTLYNAANASMATTLFLRIGGATLNADALSLALEPPNYFRHNVPEERYDPRRCRWQFGSRECGYVINGVALYTTCPKTFAACEARGEDMFNRNLGRPQPRRFGGFPGIPES